jgi:hypothetical protein
MVYVSPKAFTVLTHTFGFPKNAAQEHKVATNTIYYPVYHGAKIRGIIAWQPPDLRLIYSPCMTGVKRYIRVVAVVVISMLLASSCGSAKRCDCPSFSQVESSGADV